MLRALVCISALSGVAILVIGAWLYTDRRAVGSDQLYTKQVVSELAGPVLFVTLSGEWEQEPYQVVFTHGVLGQLHEHQRGLGHDRGERASEKR